ncbi:MAG TPA: hypothetical protein VGG99_25340 [Acetobacteraceae bacterium]
MDVFLSYNRRDAAHAATLNDWLGGQGVATFFDQRDLGAGQPGCPTWNAGSSRRPARSRCWSDRRGSATRSNTSSSSR